MKNFIKKHLLKWCFKHCEAEILEFALGRIPKEQITVTQITKHKTVEVKKGRIREWRTFDEKGVRIA